MSNITIKTNAKPVFSHLLEETGFSSILYTEYLSTKDFFDLLR